MKSIVWGTISKILKSGYLLVSAFGDIYVPKSETLYVGNLSDKMLVLCWKNEQNKLVGTERIDSHLSDKVNPENYYINKEVDGTIYKKTPLGYRVHFDADYSGIIYSNEIFSKLKLGDKVTVYIKAIRKDNKVDLSLSPIGFRQHSDANQEIILKKLKECGATLNLSDKSSPEEIQETLGMSKKKFKDTIGVLYKKRKIVIKKDRITLA